MPTAVTADYSINVKHWHEHIGEPTIADAILDRLMNHAYKIELKGDSMRKTEKIDLS